MMPGPARKVAAKRVANVRPGFSADEKLAYLRKDPLTACKAWGFICEGNLLRTSMGKHCKLRCRLDLGGVFFIEVDDGHGDWFIPFKEKQALFCDVPKGQPDGTMVVTYAMNGCAYEVVGSLSSNRFFHDSDGNSMPKGPRSTKIRIEYYDYAGEDREAEVYMEKNTLKKGLRDLEPDLEDEEGLIDKGADYDNLGNGFQNTLISIKKGNQWTVYQTVVATTTFQRKKYTRGVHEFSQIKQRVPIILGSFDD